MKHGLIARWLLRTTAIVVPVFLLASLVTFALRDVSGINPATQILGDEATPQAVADLEHAWGLDRPFLLQYASWLGHVLTGDLGRSWYSDSPVAEIMIQRAPITLSVALLALAIGVVAGGVLGTVSALKAGRWIDRGITAWLSAASTLPAFVIGIGLIATFSMAWPIFPAAGYFPLKFGWWPWLSTILLPALALSFDTAADLGRQLRAAIIEAYGRNYVLGARARGYGELRIFVRHVLPNALGPAVAILGLKFPALLGGAVVTESIFNMNGYGKFAADSSLRGDVPAVQAVLVVAVGLVLVFSVLVNLLQIRLNPASGRGY